MEDAAHMSQLPENFIIEFATNSGVTKTELDALLLALNDFSGAQIASKLEISQAAVRKRLGENYRKLGIEGSGNKKLNNLKQKLLAQYQASKTIDRIPQEDWGEAVDVDGFWGRDKEISELEQWIVGDSSVRCRLVAVLGIGGIGKTVFAAQVAKKVQKNFDYLIWRSLNNTPAVGELLTQLLRFLPKGSEPDIPDNDNSKILRLIEVLRKHRCLVVLDKVEAVLRSSAGSTYERAGEYQPTYEKYGYLFKKVAEAGHKSCLLLISREKPKQVALLEGKNLPVKVLHLLGLNLEEAKAMLKDKGFSCPDNQLRELVERYSGNPLALKIVATTIYNLFSNNITEFLNQIQQETAVYGDIRSLLDQQFNRLSELEKQLMYWLAIHREYVSLKELKDDLITTQQPAISILEAVESLLRRSLIEKEAGSGRFRQQSVVMEYITEQLIEKAYQEMRLGNCLGVIDNYPLMKARSLDYIRKTQERLILEPVTKKLLSAFGKELESKLRRMLAHLQQQSPLQRGYAAGNLINLLRQLQIDQSRIDLSGRDFSNLSISQTYFKDVNLQDTSFTNADLTSSVFTETLSSLVSVRFSTNGEFFATGAINGEVRLWRTSDTKQLRIYKGHTAWVWSFAFSPDNQILASGGADYAIKLWNVDTGECLHTLTEHTNKVYSVAFNPQGTILASASEDQTIRLWDVSTRQCLKILYGHTDWVWSVTFNPVQYDILASSSADGTIKLWDINTGECLKTLKGHSSEVYSVSFSPNGQILASSSEDQTIKLWDIITGKCKKSLNGHSKTVYSVRFSPDGKIIASCGEDRTIKLWDIETSKCLRTLRGHSSQVWSIAFSPDGRTLISSSDDQTARLWDVATGNSLNVLQGYTRGVYSVAFSPDNQVLASGLDDYTIILWELRTGKSHFVGKHQGHVRSVAFNPNGQILASAGGDNNIKLWDVQDVSQSKCLNTLTGHTNWVWTVVFSPDGKTLASSSEDQTVRIWDTCTGECLKILQGHSHWVWTVAFSPQGTLLASGSADNTVKLWDVPTGKCIATLADHKNLVWSVAFSPDGEFLASGSEDQTAKLWKISTGECQKTLEGHTQQVYSVAFSPDGKTLATGSGDGTVKLWQVSTGICLDPLTRGHTGAIRSVAFSSVSAASPEGIGRLLASGSEDENIQLWDVHKCSRLRQLKSDRLYERMEITGITGLTDAEKSSLKALGAIETGERLI
ncbi:Fis family transcriptional regulator [Brasilonema octagenarum UFV-E1]|uniref:Fis family transcriptional regulator n=3 Tax=Brasilonema TaxID=383614 RepID=A0A856MDA8_9CYAN|nr:NB-ARC domain-containing protein [Brasilonema octagenarum]NMF63389.1 Fis family transcriptional regulator [Brasilonema octagenarum UFV-OR1]QDL08662.1 Fis family transcriptional regulator [Brasilonema sennae CENA114]QDL15017.1 Fis family transcriptional regulator [Brasilonema octagenarum UFV-E1]